MTSSTVRTYISPPPFHVCQCDQYHAAYMFHIGHPCFDQSTPVKTRYPLTSITWPYRGLKLRAYRSAAFSEQDVHSDLNVCFNFLLTYVATSLNTGKTRNWLLGKTEYRQRVGWGGGGHRRLPLIPAPEVTELLPKNRVTSPLHTNKLK